MRGDREDDWEKVFWPLFIFGPVVVLVLAAVVMAICMVVDPIRFPD